MGIGGGRKRVRAVRRLRGSNGERGEGCQCQWEVPEKAGRIKERRCEKGRCALKLLLVSEISHRQALSLVRRLQHLQCFRFAPPPTRSRGRVGVLSLQLVAFYIHPLYVLVNYKLIDR